MSRQDFTQLTDADQLRRLLGPPMPRALTKVRHRLHAHDRAWLAAASFCLLATADADGRCDVSPKGDPPGFIHVVDDTTLAIPDRPGNARADGHTNILGNPHVGLLAVIPGRDDTLRVNGRARLVTDGPCFDAMTVRGHRPVLAILVEVEEVFFHCAKAFMRGAVWDATTWRPDAMPGVARLTKDTQVTDLSLQELEEYYGPAYARRLYRAPEAGR